MGRRERNRRRRECRAENGESANEGQATLHVHLRFATSEKFHFSFGNRQTAQRARGRARSSSWTEIMLRGEAACLMLLLGVVVGGVTGDSAGGLPATLRLRGGTGQGGPSRGFKSNGNPWRWRHPTTMSLRVSEPSGHGGSGAVAAEREFQHRNISATRLRAPRWDWKHALALPATPSAPPPPPLEAPICCAHKCMLGRRARPRPRARNSTQSAHSAHEVSLGRHRGASSRAPHPPFWNPISRIPPLIHTGCVEALWEAASRKAPVPHSLLQEQGLRVVRPADGEESPCTHALDLDVHA